MQRYFTAQLYEHLLQNLQMGKVPEQTPHSKQIANKPMICSKLFVTRELKIKIMRYIQL